MQTVKTWRSMKQLNSKNYLLFAIILISLIGLGLLIKNIGRAFQATSKPNESGAITQISQADLEDQYGLRINLIAVTAAGGLVDVRFNFNDGIQAKSLLQDANNFPALLVGENNVVLHVPEDAKPQEISFVDDGKLYLLYPNSDSAVKPGTPVTVLFGNIQLEPIIAK